MGVSPAKTINGVGAEELCETEAAKLNHPNIISVYHHGSVNTGGLQPSPFIVMELIQGTRLEEVHGLSFTQIIDLARQVCDALDHAHTQGLVHHDLKPSNVLVEKHSSRKNGSSRVSPPRVLEMTNIPKR